MTKEDRSRSAVKALGYRVLSIIGSFAVLWAVTGDIKNSLELTFWTNAVGIVVYYGWERLWDRIQWRRR